MCVKALPDVYDLGEVIQSVVTPSHTCIIVNTTASIGIEAALMKSYPRNMVLSLCSGIDIAQIGPAEFDHTASKPVFVGAIRENPALPPEAQQDMIESLTLTLEAGAVECSSTNNIEKYQWEKLIGMISFYPVSVILQEPNHAALMEDVAMKDLVNKLVDECLTVAEARSCSFSYDFKLRTIASQTASKDTKSTMYQDFLARRPLEIEVFLATPIRLAEEREVAVPYLRSVYALLKHINKVNQTVPSTASPAQASRLTPQYTGQSIMGQKYYQGRPSNDNRTMSMMRGPPGPNGMNARMPPQVQQPRPRQRLSRDNSLDGLEEFATVAMYNDLVPSSGDYTSERRETPPLTGHAPLRPNGRQMRPPVQRASSTQHYYSQSQRGHEQSPRTGAFNGLSKTMGKMRMSGRNRNKEFDDDEDDDDYIDVPVSRGPPIDPSQVDMLAMTRRGRNSAMANRLESDRTSSFATARPKMRQGRTSSSQALINDIPNVHDAVTASALFGMGDNRYGTVDSRSLAKQAQTGRLNSMQSERMNSMSQSSYQNGHAPRPQGPPVSMNGRSNYANATQYRGQPQYAQNSFRAPLPGQPHNRQQLMPQMAAYPGKPTGQNLGDPGVTRSVTGSASASFGSLGNGSGSHSSSSSRDEVPPVPVTNMH